MLHAKNAMKRINGQKNLKTKNVWMGTNFIQKKCIEKYIDIKQFLGRVASPFGEYFA